jgi:Fe-S cluster biogenesis protein NfuA
MLEKLSMMTTQPNEHDLQRIESLIRKAESAADPEIRDAVRQLVEGLLDYHGAAFARTMEIVRQQAPHELVAQLCADELVASALLLYDLHPDDVQTRIERALEDVRPYLASHGGNVSLIGVDRNGVRLRMQGSCHGCPSSTATLKNLIEEAVFAAAPEVSSVELEEEDENGLPPTNGFVPVTALTGTNGRL